MTDDNEDNEDRLGKALGLNPLGNEISPEVDKLLDAATDDSARLDFENARAAIIDVMQTTQELAQRASEVADVSQSARSFEAAANLLKTQLQASRDLLSLQRDIRMIHDVDRRISKPSNVTNQILIASTSDMLDRLLEKKNNDDQEDKGN